MQIWSALQSPMSPSFGGGSPFALDFEEEEAWLGMQWVMVLTVITLYVGSIIFTDLVGHGIIFGGEDHMPEQSAATFGTTARSLFSLFKLMNTDMTVADAVAKSVAGKFLFALFMVASNWMILAVLTSVVSDHMISASSREVREDNEKISEKLHAEKTRRLLACFRLKDPDNTTALNHQDFQELLDDEEVCEEMCNASGLLAQDLKDLYYCLADQNQCIQYHDFVEVLHSHAEEADKRAIYWVRADMRDMEARLEKRLRAFTLRKKKKQKGKGGQLVNAKNKPEKAVLHSRKSVWSFPLNSWGGAAGAEDADEDDDGELSSNFGKDSSMKVPEDLEVEMST